MTDLNSFKLDSCYYSILVNVDELWLKGKNRPFYYQALRQHIITLVKNYHWHSYKLTHEVQRFVISSEESFSEEFIQALAKIPGIKNIVPSKKVKSDLDSITHACIDELKRLNLSALNIKTFKVETFRIDKKFPVPSMSVSREIGGAILQSCTALKVDIHNPDLQIEIRIMPKNSHVSAFKIPGIGGLPTATTGKVLSLLSGGIDSPVSSFMMMKRGCDVNLCFFYAYPFVGEAVKEKILKLASKLGVFQRCTNLYVVNFGPAQEKLAKTCLPEYRTLFFRKLMIEIASNLAAEIGASALITGDSLGQVSSQTLYNMAYLDEKSPTMILRPVSGLNKSEIIEIAKEIGTYETSILPQDDACSLFAVKHPILVPNRDYCERFMAENSFQEEIEKAQRGKTHFVITARGEVKEIIPITTIRPS